MLRVPFISLAVVLAVVACGRKDPVDANATNTAGLPDVKVPAPTTIGEPHKQTQTGPAEAVAPPASVIPVALQGKWGLSPADCSLIGGNAKGLLVVTAGGLNFYESHAVPAADAEMDGDSIAGNFAFSGEGQNWTRYESLKLDKQVLTRTETNPTASFSYAKCS
jgi:hypothetical protein